MSIYKSLVTAVAACVIASPVLAENAVKTAAATPAPAAKTTTAAVVKVNVNKAKAKELLNVKGINPSIARGIVHYRKKHGDFKSIEDLSKVRSLSKLNADQLKAIQEQLSL